MAEENLELRGVGGWLRFFVIVIGVISPLQMVVMTAINLYRDPQVAAAYGDVWPMLQAGEWVLVALTVAGCWYIVWRLFNVQSWATVRVTIAGIWLISVGSVVLEALGVWLISGFPLATVFGGVAAELVRPFIFGAVWTSYFMVSKRVANTYPRSGDSNAVAEVFN